MWSFFKSELPFFPLFWKHEAVLKVRLNSAQETVGVIVRVLRNQDPERVFFGRTEARTHCGKDFQDDFVIQGPWAPADNLSLDVSVASLQA
jgi:hypothetical protein